MPWTKTGNIQGPAGTGGSGGGATTFRAGGGTSTGGTFPNERWYIPGVQYSATGLASVTVTANRYYAAPLLTAAGTINALASYVGTAISTSTFRIAAYSNRSPRELYPGTLLAETTQSAATTGWKQGTVNLAVPDGLIWLVFVASHGITVWSYAPGNAMPILGFAQQSQSPAVGWRLDDPNATTAGASPTTFATGGIVHATGDPNLPACFARWGA